MLQFWRSMVSEKPIKTKSVNFSSNEFPKLVVSLKVCTDNPIEWLDFVAKRLTVIFSFFDKMNNSWWKNIFLF